MRDAVRAKATVKEVAAQAHTFRLRQYGHRNTCSER